jgi:hypothetical protein
VQAEHKRWIADLDKGAVVDRAHLDQGDIWFEAVTETERYLTPWRNGSQIALPFICGDNSVRLPYNEI